MENKQNNSDVRPQYGTILRELLAGKAIPFLGAAASRVGYTEGASSFLPSGQSLAEMLAVDSNFPSSVKEEREDLAKVSSYLVGGSNRGALRRRLREVFSGAAYPCNHLHRLLARLANKSVIVTTNYDTLLEQAFQEIKKPYDLAVYPADNEEYRNALLWWPHGASEPTAIKPNQFDIGDIGRNNLIYKIHGSIHHNAETWDSFVITEEDYVQFLSGMNRAVPAAFRQYFSERAFLFLGYGLRDWNMRVLWKQLGVTSMVSWAILYKPSAFEAKLWGRRNVDMFDMTLEEFVLEMDECLGRLMP